MTMSYAEQTIVATKVASAPIIDGKGVDSVWSQATEYITYDKVAKIPIALRSIYTDDKIFFLVSFPDSDESITHRSWVWDKSREIYRPGLDREDVFVLKWNMELHPVDLSIRADDEYTADIWFWKACRTNPVGYADDKFQHYSPERLLKSSKQISRTGKKMYLIRPGDSGEAAYQDHLYTEYKGNRIAKYTNKIPHGSRADIKAKGVWSDGKWTIEFARALKTGNNDDIQFDTSKSYLFGVSRYEIAGRKPNSKLTQPFYGSGDIGEVLTLQFGK
jgi:hypothetical protein